MSNLELVTDRYRSNKNNNVRVGPPTDIIDAVERDKIFARSNPSQYAKDLSVLMGLLDLARY